MTTLPTAPVTLSEALAIVAKASFYEDVLITPAGLSDEGEPVYTVEADSPAMADGSWDWTYNDGTTCDSRTDEVSRLHEAYEFYETPGHIEVNMSASVAVLTEGTHAVHFGYAVPEAPCECEHAANWDPELDECEGSHAAGWVLAATWHSLNPAIHN